MGITTTTSPIKKKRSRPRKKKSKNNIDYDNDTPPQGILPSLWYTREAGLHIFVIEKILGWNTRPIYNYDVNVQTLNLTINQIQKISSYILDHATKTGNWNERMNVSRIYPQDCPTIKKALSLNPPTPSALKEEIVLVKWRGFSYIHTSWERINDLLQFESTSKLKLKRFYQSQESMYG